MSFHLAQINIARMRGVNIDDPIMMEFVDNLDRINNLAEQSDGFVWRLKDEHNDATSLNPYNNEQIIVNISVWRDVESLKNYTYKTMHAQFLKRRKEWFRKFGNAYYALWWLPAGTNPTLEQSVARLNHFQEHGASDFVFDFKQPFPKPSQQM